MSFLSREESSHNRAFLNSIYMRTSDQCRCHEQYLFFLSYLEAQRVPSPGGKQAWRETTIRSILSNEKYKGDAVLGKTYVENCLTKQLAQQADAQQAQAGLRSRLDEVYDALDALQNHPLAYDDYLVRQTLSHVIAVSKHLIRVVFPDGLEVEQEVE